jgi:hypothetical protein
MLPMRNIHWVLLCVLSTTMAYGQSAKDAFRAFHDVVVHQRLVLRNFSGDVRVHAVWTGAGFQMDAPKWRTPGVLQIRSANLRGERVTLQCDRRVLVRNDADGLALDGVVDPVEIDIDLEGGDPAQVIPKLRDALFY